MPTRNRAALLAASGLAVAALVAGCSSSGSHPAASTGSTPAAPTSPAAPASPTAPSSPAPSAPAATPALQTASSSLGTIVTDGSGFTLYRFDDDMSNPSKSNCTGSCSTLWPPAAATSNMQVKGIDSKLVGTLTRADGSHQLTLNGWPLYRYAPDSKPGDTKGQGVGGLWAAATPTGGKAGAAPAPSSPMTPKPSSPSTGGGGYGY